MITKIFERLFLGDVDNANQLGASNPLGITSVVTLCSERPAPRRTGINYVRLPLRDGCPVPPEMLQVVEAAIREGVRTGKVLVHCVSGVSRSPVMVALYVHQVGYKDFDSALRWIQELRPVVYPSPEVMESVRNYLSGQTKPSRLPLRSNTSAKVPKSR